MNYFPNYINPCYYGLCNLLNLDYYYLLGDKEKKNQFKEQFGFRNNMLVNIEKFKKILEFANVI